MADVAHKDLPTATLALDDKVLFADTSDGGASKNAIGVPVLTTAQTTAGATGVAALDASNVLRGLDGEPLEASDPGAAAYKSRVAHLLARYPANRIRPRVMTNPPEVTPLAGSISGSYPVEYAYFTTANRSLIHARGGEQFSFQNSGFYWNIRAATNNVEGTQYNPTAVGWYAFRTTAPIFELKILASTRPYRIKVDGQYVSLAGHKTVGNTGAQKFLVDFSAAGGRKEREIELEVQEEDTGFYSVAMTAIDGISAPSASPRIVIAGDSIVVGTVADTSAQSPIVRGDGWTYILGQYFGCSDVWSSGISGSGWVNPAAGSVAMPTRAIKDIVSRDPVFAVIAMGTNDYNTNFATAAQVGAAVATTIANIRLNSRYLPIVIIGIYGGVTGPSATVTSMENAIKSAVGAARANGDKYTAFVPVSTIATKPLVFGTGRQTTPNGSGNTDWAIGDGTHFTLAGNQFLADFLSDEIYCAIGEMFAT